MVGTREVISLKALADFVLSNWIEWLFAAATAVFAWCYRNISAKLKVEQMRNEAVAAGVEALLRDAIVEKYNKYDDKGSCPIYAKESLKKLYKAYHDLGGNDVATELYRKMLAMPEREDDHDEQ